MATTKQINYIADLMIRAGHAHRKGYLVASSKRLPHGPTMRQRSGSVQDWAADLTKSEASEIIDILA